jgi:thioredoxin-dependent peroxiredoxin
MLTSGKKAPLDILIKDSEGKAVSLREKLGSWVVLYFYPKDDTPGCTKEACSLRDVRGELRRLGVEVIGVSKDSPKSHKKFIEKYQLNFTLWSDEERLLMEAFGTWAEKRFMGRTYMGTLRSTFLIDPRGVISHVFEKVSPEEHGEEVLEMLEIVQKK